MATRRKYSRSAGSEVKSEMHRYQSGTAKTGRGGKVKSRQQAIRDRPVESSQKGEVSPGQEELSGREVPEATQTENLAVLLRASPQSAGS